MSRNGSFSFLISRNSKSRAFDIPIFYFQLIFSLSLSADQFMIRFRFYSERNQNRLGFYSEQNSNALRTIAIIFRTHSENFKLFSDYVQIHKIEMV